MALVVQWWWQRQCRHSHLLALVLMPIGMANPSPSTQKIQLLPITHSPSSRCNCCSLASGMAPGVGKPESRQFKTRSWPKIDDRDDGLPANETGLKTVSFPEGLKLVERLLGKVWRDKRRRHGSFSWEVGQVYCSHTKGPRQLPLVVARPLLHCAVSPVIG